MKLEEAVARASSRGAATSPIELDPRTKILVLCAVPIITASTPPEAQAAFIAYFLLLAVFAWIVSIDLQTLLRRCGHALPFLGLMLASILLIDPPTPGPTGPAPESVASARAMLFWSVANKSLLGILALAILTASCPLPELLEGLDRLGCPRTLTQLAGLTYRYLFVLAEEFQRMKRARDARAYGGRWLWQGRVIGAMVGTLFLRSIERGERVHLAMRARGYLGHWPLRPLRALRGRDIAVIVGAYAILLAARFEVAL